MLTKGSQVFWVSWKPSEKHLPNPECLHLFVPREASKSMEMGMNGTHEVMSKMLFILIFL